MRYGYFRYAGRLFSIFIIILITAPFYSAQSAVYYVDEKGVVHFVDDETLVPEKYREKKKTIDKVDEDIPVERPAEKKDILKKDETEEPKDKMGNTAAYWRQRYKALVNEKLKKERELRDLENQRDELSRQYEAARSRAFFVGDSQSVTLAANLELKLRELENMIKMTVAQLDELNRKVSVDIYNELIQAGGRTEWLLSNE